jgi:hypothetical protein
MTPSRTVGRTGTRAEAHLVTGVGHRLAVDVHEWDSPEFQKIGQSKRLSRTYLEKVMDFCLSSKGSVARSAETHLDFGIRSAPLIPLSPRLCRCMERGIGL